MNDVLPTYSITAKRKKYNRVKDEFSSRGDPEGSPLEISINEGDIVEINISTNNLNHGYHPYTLSGGWGVYANDFADTILSFPKNSSISWSPWSPGTSSLQFHLLDDQIKEDDETLYFKLYSDISRSTQVGDTLTITIKDNEPSKTYSGNSIDYQFFNLKNNNFGIKHDNESTIDSLTGIRTVRFQDQSLNLVEDIKGVFDQVTGLNTDSGEMFRLYNAAFARFPDAEGLKYWINEFSSGRNSRRVVAQSFINSNEFHMTYGFNVSNDKYVENLYTNILGRNYDQDGYNYWVGNLNAGTETRYELLLGFAESAENKELFSEMTGLY